MAANLPRHVDLNGRVYALTGLDKSERALVKRLKSFAESGPEWSSYRNFWLREVEQFYAARGLGRREIIETVGYRVGQDLGSRLGIVQHKTRLSDYRDELEQLILTRFKTRREFCKTTGLSEDMLSHVLAKRKHLAVDTLAKALEKVGYTLHIVPLPETSV
jgi:PAS domain-containing protein